jgi:hypothetical protein
MALITAANAREMAAKGNAVRQEKRKREKERLELIDQLLARYAEDAARPSAETGEQATSEYVRKRLVRVRRCLDLIDARVEEEAVKRNADGQRLSWLSTAADKLAEQERKLAGRPEPARLRPRALQAQRRFWGAVPLDEEPLTDGAALTP